MSTILTNAAAALAAIVLTAVSFNAFIIAPASAAAVITLAPVLA